MALMVGILLIGAGGMWILWLGNNSLVSILWFDVLKIVPPNQ